jgi:hypothetical protein
MGFYFIADFPMDFYGNLQEIFCVIEMRDLSGNC